MEHKTNDALISLHTMSASKYLNFNMGQIKLLLENLQKYCLIQFTEEKNIVIPFVGNLKITYNGDKVEDGFRTPNYVFEFSPAKQLLEKLDDIIKRDDLNPTLLETELHEKNLEVFRNLI